jgi:hypothetical protein
VRYQRKPIVVQASQWFVDGDHPLVFGFEDEGHCIRTKEGLQRVMPGDWIVTQANGEAYACKPEIFHIMYTLLPPPEGEDSEEKEGPVG